MFNFFNKSPKTETKVSTSNYPAIVDEIHNEFFTAGDNILDEAKSLLTQLETQDIAKGKRLAALGFGKTREAVAAIETENKLATTKEIAELVVYYKVNYPNNKFITEEQVKAICEKYGLVCGEIGLYKGFVPESKLLEIERFKFKKEDAPFAYIEDGDGVVKKILEKDDFKNTECNFFKERMGIEGNGFFSSNSNGAKFIGYNTTTLYGTSSRIMPFNVKLKICAPLKDMEVKSNQQVKGYKIMDIPDPVVLQPVRGGYLCVCAWGDESSDEIVVNQQMN